MVEIKFRKKDLIKAMRRIDPAYKKLVEQLGERVQNAPPLRGQERPSPFRCWRVLVCGKKRRHTITQLRTCEIF